MLRVLAQQLPKLPHVLKSSAPCITQASHLVPAAFSTSSSGSQQSTWSPSAACAGASLAVAASAVAAAQSTVVQADAAAPEQALSPPADPYTLPRPTGQLPSNITLYQYEVCPFCCKVKAFLDYHKVPYSTVEVNPLTKGELRWSSYRKVPVVQMGDEVLVDSSAIISRLAAELQASSSSSDGSNKGSKSWFSGKSSSIGGSDSSSSAEEERRWRQWVDERFVKVMTANIYRTWDESWNTFSYMTQQSHWNWAVQQSVRLAGAVLMWKVGQGMPKKYNIEGDLREALYADANSFVAAVGNRQFLGGQQPNLADLAVFGVLQAIRGTDTYNDVVMHSEIGPWLSRMVQVVGESCEVKQVPGKEALSPPAAA
ncbi:hypothetical protein OEZ85_006371 [Tetradesmus obliquus]|uniref:Prostaglandin E synthase 2 n=1 Tax=Tetradesmus obliquus TaxID=3088 RepID=A0ABY8TUB3_TETOB|nr:hypothetical protein OEZ85_006371 [Tetradesmus obliquus]